MYFISILTQEMHSFVVEYLNMMQTFVTLIRLSWTPHICSHHMPWDVLWVVHSLDILDTVVWAEIWIYRDTLLLYSECGKKILKVRKVLKTIQLKLIEKISGIYDMKGTIICSEQEMSLKREREDSTIDWSF